MGLHFLALPNLPSKRVSSKSLLFREDVEVRGPKQQQRIRAMPDISCLFVTIHDDLGSLGTVQNTTRHFEKEANPLLSKGLLSGGGGNVEVRF